jgi:hypothetical protein
MKEEILKELLASYYEGMTSPEQEQMLREYFSGNDLFPGYETEREIFRMWHSQHAQSTDPDFEKRILSAIDNIEVKKYVSGRRIRLIAFTGIAAGLLILIASYLLLRQQSEPADTFSDPRLAYAETMKILNEVSVKLNKGTAPLKNISIIERNTRSTMMSIDKSATVIKGSLKPIGLVNRINNELQKEKK